MFSAIMASSGMMHGFPTPFLRNPQHGLTANPGNEPNVRRVALGQMNLMGLNEQIEFPYLNANMSATIHAGEAYGAESIHQALHYCGAHRIGHGTRLFEDPDLMGYVNDHRVPLEICLTSNVQTQVVKDFSSQPLRLYYDEGLVVSLHTDNRLMSRTTVTEEYVRAWKHLGFTLEELGDMVLNGFRSAFLHHAEKDALLAEVEPEIRRLATA